MATKKAKKKKKLVESETPITIGGGGGGGGKPALPLTIGYNPSFWLASTPAGTLTLQGGRVKKVIITTPDIEIKLPLSGAVTIDVKCGKP